jgi:HEPN domain-containing protein
MNNPESNFASWLHKADHDLLNINNNLAASQIPWDTICFHAQQIAEKVLKGFLVYHGRDLVKTHDLIALLAPCVTLDPTGHTRIRLPSLNLVWRGGTRSR